MSISISITGRQQDISHGDAETAGQVDVACSGVEPMLLLPPVIIGTPSLRVVNMPASTATLIVRSKADWRLMATLAPGQYTDVRWTGVLWSDVAVSKSAYIEDGTRLYTVADSPIVLADLIRTAQIDSAAGPVAITIPASMAVFDRRLTFKAMSASLRIGAITIATEGPEKIEALDGTLGDSAQIISPGTSLDYRFDGTNWVLA
jgi:hypothetical protein